MKLTAERPFTNPEVAARKLVEIASGIEPVQDGRIHMEKINAPFLYTLKASGEGFGAEIKMAVERGWLELHESGTYVRLLKGLALQSPCPSTLCRTHPEMRSPVSAALCRTPGSRSPLLNSRVTA
ncbi:hypothetical protein [Bradyrhizobium sp. Ec3.3]|uniref:hypothetical protein n=1 Tax=Bradyrhizobium sp. Ec3.3 TaxID=189753 RepID=UPI000411DDC8